MNLPDHLTIVATSSTQNDPFEALARQGTRVMLQAALGKYDFISLADASARIFQYAEKHCHSNIGDYR
jgi:hypothetical protein